MNSSQLAQQSLKQRLKFRARRHLGAWGVFFKGFIKHPVMVGAIWPSSQATVRSMLQPVKWHEVKLFVEYGPGVGTFSDTILEHLPGDATYIAIDTNPDFIEYLREHIRDSRFHAVHGSAGDVEEIVAQFGFDHADYVLSGLPFSTLPNNLGPKIAASTAKVLRSGGAFLVYQYSAAARDYMKPHFSRIDQGVEYRNLPPCKLFWGWKS